jgi:hypothetical protein
MATYVYPGNLNYRTIQTIPVDTTNKLRQGSNGVDAAQKVQDLHVQVFADGVEVDASVTSTVASVLVPQVVSGKTVQVPAYRVNVNGWTNTADEVRFLKFVGGFPRAFTSDQNVNPTKASAVLPEGTITSYESTNLDPSPLCVFPSVVLVGGLPVVLKDKNENVKWPTWELVVEEYCTVTSQHNFNFSFHLLVQPGTD